MPRRKTLSDDRVLASAHDLLHRHGPEALTFASLAQGCGLSAATLVQRFASKAGMIQATLLYAWDRLDERTARLAAAVPKTPAGAIELLVGLSRDYGGIEAYANGLLVLREDLRDPVLRARGAAWKAALCRALEACLADESSTPADAALLMASQWQGSLLWWSFDPRGRVEDFAESELRLFLAALAAGRRAGRTKRAASVSRSRGRTK